MVLGANRDEVQLLLSELSGRQGVLAKWVRVTQKLARFGVALKAFSQLPLQLSTLFSIITVKALLTIRAGAYQLRMVASD